MSQEFNEASYSQPDEVELWQCPECLTGLVLMAGAGKARAPKCPDCHVYNRRSVDLVRIGPGPGEVPS